MFKCRFVIVCFTVFFYRESNAEFWCAENHLHSLIECLVDTDIKNSVPSTNKEIEEFELRFECAKNADCTPKPWDIFRPKIQTLRTFVGCMDSIQLLHTIEEGSVSSIKEEYFCRKKLTYSLPYDLYRLYHKQLLPPDWYV